MDKRKKYHLSAGWKTMVVILAFAVVFSTVGAMVLPAIALEKTCTLQEHQHSDACYGIVSMEQGQAESESGTEERVLICGLQEHIHTDVCGGQQESEPVEQTQPTAQTETQTVEQTEIPATEQTQPTAQTETQAAEWTEVSSTAQTEANASAVPDQRASAPTAEKTDLQDEDDLDSGMNVAQTPIDVAKYTQKASMKYKEKNNQSGDWQEAGNGVVIPGNARLHLEIEYDKVPLEELIANGGRMTFEVPAVMRDPEAQGEISGDSGVVGKIQVNGHTLDITFDVSWLQGLADRGETTLYGKFYVESDVDLAALPGGGGSVEVQFGDVSLSLTFDADVVAQYGQIEVEKTVSKHVEGSDGAHYLEYTLTVRTGPDSMPEVKVVDYFDINGEYTRYEGITPEPQILTAEGDLREEIDEGRQHGSIYKGHAPTQDQPIPAPNQTGIQEPGSIVWDIGVMEAREVRTLTYRVKLQDHHHLFAENPLRNRAAVFSKSYKRDEKTVDFTPQANLQMNKSHTDPVRVNADGSYKMTYTVRFTTPESNNHVLKNLRIVDKLNDKDNATDEKLLPYIRYDQDSFRLYHAANPGGQPVPVNQGDGKYPTLVFAQDGKSFTLSMGNLGAGESYCFQYDLKIDASAFAAGNLWKLTVKNRAQAIADNANQPNASYIQKSDDNGDIQYPHWIKKTAQKRLDADLTIKLVGQVYDATGGQIVPQPDKPTDFKVLAGSYEYQILVNELGDFDVTQAEIKDVLKSKYMQYDGYLRIDAHNPKQPGSDPLGTLVESRWVKIDGLRSFDIQLKTVGFADNSYAYRLTYYARPVDIGNINQASAVNTVNLSGQVGRNGETFPINGFESQAEVVLQGGHSFEVNKEAWYYENPTVTEGDWKNGSIYWSIKIDGTHLYKGSFIKDHVNEEHPHHQRGKLYFRGDSFVGMYIGQLPEGAGVTDYTSVEELVENGRLEQIPESKYSVKYDIAPYSVDEGAFGNIVVEMLDTVNIPAGASIYMIVKGEPNELPTDNRGVKRYTNYVTTSNDGVDYIDPSKNATKELYGGPNIMKEFDSYVSFDGKKVSVIHATRPNHIPVHLFKEGGHYLSWAVKINYAGELHGRYRVEDEIPAGTDIAFARIKWRGGAVREHPILMEQIPNYKETLGADWTEHVVTAGMDEASGEYVSYYYTNGNKVLWEVDNLIAGRHMDDYAIDFQIVCRVTDPDVLMGGVEKEFLNHVYLKKPDGTTVDSDSNGATASAQNINKSMVKDGNNMHYTITLNPTGEDLLKDADTVTLIDEMSDNLRLVRDSLKVFKTGDTAETPVDFVPTSEANKLSIVLPDSMALTIKYTARVQAKPNTTIKLWNKAYWQGYASGGGSEAGDENFRYEVGGTAGGAKNPTVRIVKRDKENFNTKLSGAEFLLEEGRMDDTGAFTATGRKWTGKTNQDGVLIFANNKTPMHYNVVYRLTETKAPEHYNKTDEQFLFLVAKDKDGQYPAYPDGVDVHYGSSVYELDVENQKKGTASVEKRFQNVDGTEAEPILGIYRFGLFGNKEGTGTALQSVTIDITDKTSDARAVFTDLEPNQIYYVFELDDAGQPIKDNGFGNVNGTGFQVVYRSDSDVDVHAAVNGQTVTVTNRMVSQLPETGGTGSLPYALAGMSLMAGAAAAWYCMKKRQHHTDRKS